MKLWTRAKGNVNQVESKGKGRGPKKKYVFLMVFLQIKKFTPIFFLEIESMIAKTNFTRGPIEKFIFFVKL